jgi:hypothetical protein
MMIISMQGNWTVTVKSKNAAFPQRFIVQGAASGNGIYNGTPGTFVNVAGTQWSISIQSDPGTGWQSSKTNLKFPFQNGGNYEFDILSDDGGGSDTDFDDLILTCSTPVNINDFIIYGNVTLYSGRCIFNPCRKFPYVIDTYPGLKGALKNPLLREYLERYYPERIPVPNPPDPEPFFKPIVFDVGGQAMQPKTSVNFTPKSTVEKKAIVPNSPFAAANFDVAASSLVKPIERGIVIPPDKIELVKNIDRLLTSCSSGAGSNLTLTFEEYDRTSAELAGAAYSGTGNRRLLGDTITDTNGNYIFRFSFDMTFPGLEDAYDIAPGENVNVVMYPDIIVKIVEYSPFQVRYESAPFYNIPNLKRINLCLPKSQVQVSSACFNGNLIGSLGNVFIGGNQNTAASTSPAILRRYGNSNYLESTGTISVNSSLAGFGIECAAWGGTIDMKGCMYDAVKSAADNKIKWYTIRIWRDGTSALGYVTQNYRHPKFSKRNLPNYIGDDVGPFYPLTAGVLDGTIPAYTNIQREIFADGIDWEFSNLDRYMQLNTAIYDIISGVRTPGKFYVRVDGYDAAGSLVPGATDLIPLFIHNNGLNFQMTSPVINDPSIVNAGCGLFRMTDAQMKTPIVFSFEANDHLGFVDNYALTMNRCPGTALNLNANIEIKWPTNVDGHFTLAGSHTFPGGSDPLNVHHDCSGYRGTEDDYSTAGLVNVQIQPPAVGDGWIITGEYFTIYSFGLTANQRVTNGYNTGLSGTYQAYGQIMMERLNP